MKKVFILAFMLTGLSAVSFAAEGETPKKLAQNDSKEVPKTISVKKDGEVSCMAGLTSCGKTYMGCFAGGPQEVDDVEVAIIMDMAERALC